MKIILIMLSALICTALAYFFYLGYKSHSGSPYGLVKSKLAPCPKKPNCICSEYPEDISHFVDAISYNNMDEDVIFQSIQDAIKKTGGIILNVQGDYIAASYISKIFRYFDDFEVRIDRKSKLIHLRSASRVGHSDMGANLKRIKNVKKKLTQQLGHL